MVEEHTSFGMNILEPINPSIYKFKKSSQTTPIYMMNLKFKKSYTFIHTSSNSKRDKQRGRERKRKKSKSKTSLANPLPI